jgi:hypothetical protein
MTIDAEFLFDNQLIAELENLIRHSKNELFLVSPFIDLDKRIRDALSEKISKPNFKLKILFGKNENNIYKSFKKNSFDFLKQFPNVEIRYEERLHAKFYLNDTHFILTSLNLYDFSLAKNIECGIIVNYASKGLIGKIVDEADNFISSGVSKVKNNIFGIENNETDPTEKFKAIFDNSETLYKTEPILTEKKGMSRILGQKEVKSFNTLVNEFDKPKKEINSFQNKKEYKLLSVSKLSKLLNIDQKELIELFEKERLISGNVILKDGISKGIINKNYMGRDYIAFPDNLEVLNNLKK